MWVVMWAPQCKDAAASPSSRLCSCVHITTPPPSPRLCSACVLTTPQGWEGRLLAALLARDAARIVGVVYDRCTLEADYSVFRALLWDPVKVDLVVKVTSLSRSLVLGFPFRFCLATLPLSFLCFGSHVFFFWQLSLLLDLSHTHLHHHHSSTTTSP